MQTAQKRNVTEVYIGFTKYGALERVSGTGCYIYQENT